MKTFKPNQVRAKNAIILILVVLVLELILVLSTYLEYQLLKEVAAGNYPTQEQADSNDTRQAIIGIIYTIAVIISATTFIMWFRRAYANLHTQLDYLSFSEGWAAGAWFVPILNLYRPFNIMKEMYEEVEDLIKKREPFYQIKLEMNLVIFWWVCWVISSVVGNISFRLSFNTEDIHVLITSDLIGMISSLFNLVAGVLVVFIIRQYSEVEQYLSNLLEQEQAEKQM